MEFLIGILFGLFLFVMALSNYEDEKREKQKLENELYEMGLGNHLSD